MKCLNEHIARKANSEHNITGHLVAFICSVKSAYVTCLSIKLD